MQLGSEGHIESFGGFSGGVGAKSWENLQIFSLKLVQYSLLEIIKLKLSVCDI